MIPELRKFLALICPGADEESECFEIHPLEFRVKGTIAEVRTNGLTSTFLCCIESETEAREILAALKVEYDDSKKWRAATIEDVKRAFGGERVECRCASPYRHDTNWIQGVLVGFSFSKHTDCPWHVEIEGNDGPEIDLMEVCEVLA